MSTSPRMDHYASPQMELPYMTDDERAMLTRALCWYATMHGEELAQIYGWASRHELSEVCKFVDCQLTMQLRHVADGKEEL